MPDDSNFADEGPNETQGESSEGALAEITPQKSFSSKAKSIGIMLILLSGVFFFTMLCVPWFPIPRRFQLILGAALFVGVQVAWWGGVALAGSGVLAFFRKRSS